MIKPVIVSRDISTALNRPIQPLPSKQERIQQKKKTDDTAGPAWFNMKASAKTDEFQKDLKLLAMRSALDPKRHYRKNERIGSSKYTQVGTIINDATGFYNDRLVKRQKGSTLLDTLVKDSERQQYFKKKYNVLQETSQKIGKGAYNAKFASKPWATRKNASGGKKQRERRTPAYSIDD